MINTVYASSAAAKFYGPQKLVKCNVEALEIFTL